MRIKDVLLNKMLQDSTISSLLDGATVAKNFKTFYHFFPIKIKVV